MVTILYSCSATRWVYRLQIGRRVAETRQETYLRMKTLLDTANKSS